VVSQWCHCGATVLLQWWYSCVGRTHGHVDGGSDCNGGGDGDGDNDDDGYDNSDGETFTGVRKSNLSAPRTIITPYSNMKASRITYCYGLLHYYTVVTLLLHCCYTVVTVLSHCR
jgi:hypothetical protein